MKRLSIVLCLCGGAAAASLHFQESAFVAAADGRPHGWSVWGAAAPATVDLNRRYLDPWLGDMHGRRMKELRLGVNAPLPGVVSQP